MGRKVDTPPGRTAPAKAPKGTKLENGRAQGPRGEASVVIGYLGRVDPEKNVDVLIRAFQDIDAAEDVKLVVIGGGSDRRRLERRYRSARILFTGQVLEEAERIAMLRDMDIFVLPSLVEGLSLSLLEAMSCGVAPVATDVGADGEALRAAGILLDPRDLDGQLRLALRTLLDFPDFRAELARRARARVLERYSLSDNLDRLLSLYREIRPARGTAALA